MGSRWVAKLPADNIGFLGAPAGVTDRSPLALEVHLHPAFMGGGPIDQSHYKQEYRNYGVPYVLASFRFFCVLHFKICIPYFCVTCFLFVALLFRIAFFAPHLFAATLQSRMYTLHLKPFVSEIRCNDSVGICNMKQAQVLMFGRFAI